MSALLMKDALKTVERNKPASDYNDSTLFVKATVTDMRVVSTGGHF